MLLSKYPVSDVRNDRIKSLPKNGEERSLALLSAKITLPGKKEVIFSTVHFALDAATRLIQAEQTSAYLKRGLPTILTGDLNAEPDKKEILKLKDQFSQTGSDEAHTYPVNSPVKTIDYVMVSKEHLQKVLNSEVLNNIDLSDHLPLVSKIKLVSKK